MKNLNADRVIAALLIGTAFGWYVHFDYVKWSQRGREAFIAYQSHRFDQFMVVPHSAAVTVLSRGVFIVITFGIYELIAFGIRKMLRNH